MIFGFTIISIHNDLFEGQYGGEIGDFVDVSTFEEADELAKLIFGLFPKEFSLFPCCGKPSVF